MEDTVLADTDQLGGGERDERAAVVEAGRKVPARRMSFEESLAELPKHFAADGDLVMSHVIASLSAVFPDGEDFFVRSVRHYRDRIQDPVLKRQVAGFIGQEAIHGREHRALNERLDQLGYPTKRIERFTRRGLGFRERVAPPISNLAATAALEHFTATLAELLLADQACRDQLGDTPVLDVFLWHALEEAEHKAVAFDVYRAVGGSERLRIMTMRFTRYGFVIGMTLQTLAMIATDPASRRRGVLRKSLRKLRSSPFLTREVWRMLKAYERPGFHPDDRDTDSLVAEWREKLFGAEGTLNDRLVGVDSAAA
jgi:predicted metal-dependent hydrolase